MRTMRLLLVSVVAAALIGVPSHAALSQDDEAAGAVGRDVVFELSVPADVLPDDFVKLVVEQWLIDPGTDFAGSPAGVLGNEALRGRGILLERGELHVTPATDALLWPGAIGEPETVPAGEMVALAVGDLLFLPAVPDEDVEGDEPIGIANPGSEVAEALSFHTHQSGGTFYGYPQGLSLGGWDMAAPFDPDAVAAFDDTDIVLTLSQVAGEPGASIPIAEAPAIGMYFVEEGQLQQVTSGPKGDYTWTFDAGRNISPRPEWPVFVAGDGPASVLELTAFPQAATD